MHRLEVRRGHVTVSLRGRKVRVPQCPLQSECVSTPAKVVGSVAMPGSMERAGWWFKAHLAAELLDAAKDISAAHLGPVPRCEHKPIAGRICDVTHKTLAEFGAEGNDSCLAALPVQLHQQIVEVNGVTTQRKHFTDACSHIE